jgi:hypothetical protein
MENNIKRSLNLNTSKIVKRGFGGQLALSIKI